MGFNCLNDTEPLREDSLLFTTKSYSFNQRRMDERLSQPRTGATKWYLNPGRWTGNPAPQSPDHMHHIRNNLFF